MNQAQAVQTTPSKPHRQRSIAAMVNQNVVKAKKQTGRPTVYTQKISDEIVKRVSNGETLSVVVKDLGLYQDSVYAWLKKHKDFSERYRQAKENQAVSLLNELLDESKELKNDRALAVRVRADIVRWYAGKVNPETFGDTKRIELKGEITHKHIHELADYQKRKIAEAWLMSQADDSQGITSETTGPNLPALESVAVREICEGDQGIVPKRKRSAPALVGPKGKAKGKKPKPDLEAD